METDKPSPSRSVNRRPGLFEILRARGIKYFFGNSGTDFGPIIDALAKFGVRTSLIDADPAPHEFVAVSMAQDMRC
jgi:thiamine pyrophosphate-dependent acetolactate synthase large subunit-like protein